MKDCSSQTKCLPLNAISPEPNPINDRLPCDDATGVCKNGKCDGSICHAEGLEVNKFNLLSWRKIIYQECETSERTCLRYCIYEGGICSSIEYILKNNCFESAPQQQFSISSLFIITVKRDDGDILE